MKNKYSLFGMSRDGRLSYLKSLMNYHDYMNLVEQNCLDHFDFLVIADPSENGINEVVIELFGPLQNDDVRRDYLSVHKLCTTYDLSKIMMILDKLYPTEDTYRLFLKLDLVLQHWRWFKMVINATNTKDLYMQLFFLLENYIRNMLLSHDNSSTYEDLRNIFLFQETSTKAESLKLLLEMLKLQGAELHRIDLVLPIEFKDDPVVKVCEECGISIRYHKDLLKIEEEVL